MDNLPALGVTLIIGIVGTFMLAISVYVIQRILWLIIRSRKLNYNVLNNSINIERNNRKYIKYIKYIIKDFYCFWFRHGIAKSTLIAGSPFYNYTKPKIREFS